MKAKTTTIGIGRDEWLKAMEDAGMLVEKAVDPEAVTIAEFATLFGMPTEAAGRKLRALARAGKATRAQKWATGSDGRRYLTTAYRLVK